MGERGRWIRRVALVVLAIAAFFGVAAGISEASPYIHAHRGGPLATADGDQAPAYVEGSLTAFATRADDGYVLEVDAKLTADGVAVAMHDATLNRTTDCAGPVAARTLAELRSDCRLDLLGIGDEAVELPPGDARRERVPTIEQVLDLARERGARVNLEIKNVPTDPDFDPGTPPAFAEAVADQIKDARYPPSWLIVQSFWPANLDVIEADPYFRDTATSFLSLDVSNEAAPAFADSRGYEYVSPAWPVSQAFVSEAHGLGLQVVPYTIDDPAEVAAAAELGVDAVISNDPGMARRVLREVQLPAPRIPPPPTRKECLSASAERLEPPIESYDHTGRRAPRVFAIQFKQELRHVRTYEDFRTKIECMIREYVEPRLAAGRPNVVALNEDVGLMTLATGSRGAGARQIFEDPNGAPGCEGQPAPCGVGVAIAAIRAGYAKETGIYESRFPTIGALGGTFVAGTDTFARGWMQVFRDMARRYGVYILGSNNQAPFRESRDPADIEAFADPDLPRPDSVYVATRPFAYNEVFMWGPENVRREGPRVLRNVVVSNKKVPLTPIEQLIEIKGGPKSGPDAVENLRPYAVPGTGALVGFATSKPAFEYGHDLGTPPPPGGPCADVAVTYMRCLDALGTNLVMQDEANPSRWTAPSGEGNWTPLEFMRSTWRAIADPDVSFDYNVIPHMVGNLADLPFDGQTAITQRGPVTGDGARGPGCNYVGTRSFMPGAPENDPAYLEPYAGRKREFLGIVPWVAEDAPRDELRETGAALAAGSGSDLENDYVESAIVADLPFPPNASRPRCGRGSVERAGPCRNLRVGTFRADRIGGGRRGDRIKGLGGPDTLRGRRGRDCLHGAQGNDELRGARGRDRAAGGKGGDEVRGGRGADVLKGGDGADLLIGQRGRDRIVGGAGPDRMRGTQGDDRIIARGGGRDRVRCGAGRRDLAKVDRRDRVHRSCERVRRR